MAQSISSVMGAPSFLTTRQSWIVGCCMERYNSSTFHAGKAKTEGRRYCIRSSSHSTQANRNPNLQTTKERIRKLFNNVELSVSSYDTAWVAMVPSPNAPKSPCFPECLDWLKDNQLDDGSWGLVQSDSPILPKDALSSTLACVVALKRWNVGEDQISKGLCFIESYLDFATDKNQPSPIGFDIIFPGMLEYAEYLNLKLPFKQEDLNVMLHERDLELSRKIHSSKAKIMRGCFKGIPPSWHRLKAEVQSSSYLWITNRAKWKEITWRNWCEFKM